MRRFYDNSRLTEGFKLCPRFYYFRHVRHWRKEGLAAPLAFGGAWHSGQDAIWEGICDNNFSQSDAVEKALVNWKIKMLEEGVDYTDPTYALTQMRNEGTARRMFEDYVAQNYDFLRSINLIQVELSFAVPLDESGDLFYIGRLDKVFEQNDQRYYIGEHKTTSDYKKDGYFKEKFILSFSPNSQIDGYLFGGHMTFGDKLKSIWVDAALVHKTVSGFRFIPIERSFEQLDSWLFETRYWIDRLEDENLQLAGCSPSDSFLAAFPKNTKNCATYTMCTYGNLCKYTPNPLTFDEPPEGFIVDKWEPFDVLELEKIGMTKE